MAASENKPREWHKGPPPHVGWWNASFEGPFGTHAEEIWRWWDGNRWSMCVLPGYAAEEAARQAETTASEAANAVIQWTDYYPKNARVPRINPNE